MSKFKITVETKSRSKIVLNIEAEQTKDYICDTIVEGYREDVLQIGGTVFNMQNVNYVSVDEVE